MADPAFFTSLAAGQAPKYLWIGCADSRVPPNEILGLDPGEIFVHRNIANLASPQDLSYLSVLQYAVEALRVEHILVVGHYGCGGVKAAVSGERLGLIDHWLHPIRETHAAHQAELQTLEPHAQHTRLCELNVLAQVHNVANDIIVRNAWSKGQSLHIHGWVYALETGLLKDLGATVSGA